MQQLEMFYHRTGYRPGEPMASHSRKRYRLVPSHPNMPNCDQSLFLLSYSKASPRDVIPHASIPLVPQLQQQMQQRRVIQTQGQLARKEFMLHDRSNWPTVSAPQAVARSSGAHRRGGSTADIPIEEEEDVSRGDILDFLSPRDISRARYEQHHEWMEEVLESPYSISQIVPGDLGLGRKGELESLTKDFFHAPTTVLRETSGNSLPRVGKLEDGKADEFSRRATQKIAEMEAELEKMKKKHTERLARLKRTSILSAAEKQLRTVSSASERRTSAGSPTEQPSADAIDEIVQTVEEALGMKVSRQSTVTLVAAGGLDQRESNRSMSMSSQTKPQMSPVKASASPAIQQQQPVQDAKMTEQQPIPQPEPSPEASPTQNDQQESDSEEMVPASTTVEDQKAAEQDEKSASANGDAEELNLDDVGDDLDVNMGDDFDAENQQDDLINPENDWIMDMDGAKGTPQDDTAVEVPKVDEPAVPAENEDSKLGQDDKPSEAIPMTQPEARAQPLPQLSAEQTPNNGTPADHSSNEHHMDEGEFGEAFQSVDADTVGDDLNLDGMDDSEFFGDGLS